MKLSPNFTQGIYLHEAPHAHRAGFGFNNNNQRNPTHLKSQADDCPCLRTVRSLHNSPNGRPRLPRAANLIVNLRASSDIPVRELNGARGVLLRHPGEMCAHHLTKAGNMPGNPNNGRGSKFGCFFIFCSDKCLFYVSY